MVKYKTLTLQFYSCCMGMPLLAPAHLVADSTESAWFKPPAVESFGQMSGLYGTFETFYNET
jgi:hypothetical protein